MVEQGIWEAGILGSRQAGKVSQFFIIKHFRIKIRQAGKAVFDQSQLCQPGFQAQDLPSKPPTTGY